MEETMANRNMDSNPFAEYMWMGEMEEFDQEIEAQIEKEFQEEEFIRSCIEQLLEEEEEQTVYFQSNNSNKSQEVPSSSNGYDPLANQMNSLYINPHQGVYHAQTNTNGYQQHYSSHPNNFRKPKPQTKGPVKTSTLNPNAMPFIMNPNAKEFVPTFSSMPKGDSQPMVNGNSHHQQANTMIASTTS